MQKEKEREEREESMCVPKCESREKVRQDSLILLMERQCEERKESERENVRKAR